MADKTIINPREPEYGPCETAPREAEQPMPNEVARPLRVTITTPASVPVPQKAG